MDTAAAHSRQTLRGQIEHRLETFFVHAAGDGMRMCAEMGRYQLSTGGKRLRALIPCEVYAACGHDPAAAIPIGCALEICHNATLVHDDLQDGDTVRRGLPTVWKKYSEAQAINSGDALFHFAFEMLDQLDVPAESLRKLVRRLSRATLRVIEGQAQEFVMKDESFPGYVRYTGVIDGKTAELLAAAVALPLEAIGSDERLVDAASTAAMRAGRIFQIQDDLLDIYGDKGRDRRATDIAEGKVSALVALTNDLASPDERVRLAEILRLPRERTGAAEIAEALALFERHAIRDRLLSEITQLEAKIRDDRSLAAHAPLHRLLQDLVLEFLRPIEHLRG